LQVNTDCDEFGNTALHMCVIHDQADMYDFLVDYCAASEAVRNHGGLTPLCLAAQTGKSDMLQHVYNRRRRAFYSFGKVRHAIKYLTVVTAVCPTRRSCSVCEHLRCVQQAAARLLLAWQGAACDMRRRE
jgi:hypothetical protein